MHEAAGSDHGDVCRVHLCESLRQGWYKRASDWEIDRPSDRSSESSWQSRVEQSRAEQGNEGTAFLSGSLALSLHNSLSLRRKLDKGALLGSSLSLSPARQVGDDRRKRVVSVGRLPLTCFLPPPAPPHHPTVHTNLCRHANMRDQIQFQDGPTHKDKLWWRPERRLQSGQAPLSSLVRVSALRVEPGRHSRGLPRHWRRQGRRAHRIRLARRARDLAPRQERVQRAPDQADTQRAGRCGDPRVQ